MGLVNRCMAWQRVVWMCIVSVAALGLGTAQAQGEPLDAAAAKPIKIGYVSLDRILRDSAPARAGGRKLEAEFAQRDKALQEMGAQLRAAAARYEKEAPSLDEATRVKRQREVQELDREFQRKQRSFREDFNQRRNEEVQALIDLAQRVVSDIAEKEKFDFIFQDAVYHSERVDITERVLKALGESAQ